MSSAAWEGDICSGSGGVGTSSEASWSTSRTIRAGSGRSCTRYRQGVPRAASSEATASLAAIIRFSIRRWDSVCSRGLDRNRLAVLVEAELGLLGFDLQRAADRSRARCERPRPPRGHRPAAAPTRSCGALVTGEDAIHPLVVQARVGADQRAVEGAAAHPLRCQLELELHGHRQPIGARASASRRRWRGRAGASARPLRGRTRSSPCAGPRGRARRPRATWAQTSAMWTQTLQAPSPAARRRSHRRSRVRWRGRS